MSNMGAEEMQSTPIAILRNAARERADAIFLDFSGELHSYGDIDRKSTGLGHSLIALGVKPGEVVVTLLDNHVDAILCWFGVTKTGAIWAPINTAYKRDFLAHQMADTGARIAICEQHYVERILEIGDKLPDLELLVVRGAAAGSSSSIKIMDFEKLRGDNAAEFAHVARPSDVACLIYTSGTTGPSKGCMISHNYMCNFGRQVLRSFPQTSDDIVWAALPLFHMAALCNIIMPTMIVGGRASLYPRFSVNNFWPEIERSGATNTTLLGAMFNFVAEHPDSDAMRRCYGQLKAVLGGPVTPEVRDIWFKRFGVGYINSYGYGQTEGCKITTLEYGEPLPPADSAGRAGEDFEVMIGDENDRAVAPGVVGEILFRPRKPHIMFEGYWRRPAETLAVWRNMWMHTGDLGRMDAEGNLYFVDRKKDYVRRRGENISSFEVENIFLQHPEIAEAAFHAVPSEFSEDDLKVTVVLTDDARLAERDLHIWARERLPEFAVPRYIEFREMLPRTPTGRLQKFQLRAEGKTKSTWDAADARVG